MRLERWEKREKFTQRTEAERKGNNIRKKIKAISEIIEFQSFSFTRLSHTHTHTQDSRIHLGDKHEQPNRDVQMAFRYEREGDEAEVMDIALLHTSIAASSFSNVIEN